MKTEKSRTVNVLRNMTAGMFVKGITLVLSFVSKTIFIKLLGIQYTGVSSLFTDILTVLSLAELGISSAITYALYKPVAEQDGRQIARLMNFYKTAYRVVALAVLFFGLALVPFLDRLVTDVPDIKESITLVYMLYLMKSACSYLFIYKSAILNAKQKKYEISKIEGSMAVVKLLTECLVLWLFRQFLVYLLADILLTVLQNILISKRAEREYDSRAGGDGGKLGKQEKLAILADVKALAMYQISGVCLSGTDSIVISSMLGTGLVGLLSSYKIILQSVTSLLQQFFNAANAGVGNLAAEGEREKQYRLFQGLNFAVFWVSTFCSTALYVLLNPFVELWLGRDYLLGEPVVLALVSDFYITNMIRCVALFRTSNGLFVQGRYRPVIMTVINVALSVLLAYRHGIFGVLIATVIARAVTQVWYDPWLIYREIFRKNVGEYYKNYIGYFLTAVIGILLIQAAARMATGMAGNPCLLFLLKAVLCLAVPNGLIVLFWHRTEQFGECVRRIGKIAGMVKGRGRRNGR